MSRQTENLDNIPWKSEKNKIYLNWCGAERIREDVLVIENRYRKWQQLYEDDPKGSIRVLSEAIDNSRNTITELLGNTDPRHIIFTTGSEESLKRF